jgi:4-amino-4-deoxy-L-arabinose transferase-like glycosyltransferase
MSVPASASDLRHGRYFLARAAGRLFRILAGPAKQGYAVPAVLAGYVAVWTLYAVVAKSSQDIHPDTAELFAWSNELALGYWKHPPFGVYVVKAWTTIFPVADWSFYLLGMANAALALWIAWRLSSLVLSDEKRALGLALLTLVPFFNFLALNYNHTTLLMPLWALTTLFFLKSFESRHLGFAALTGFAAGVAMLGKYWTVVLLAGLALAAVTDPRRRDYFRSAAPWVTIIAGGLVIAPHLVWLYRNHFVAIAYATSVHADGSVAAVGASAVKYLLACLLYVLIPVVVVAIAVRPSGTTLRDMLFPKTPERRLVAVMFWAPLLLPLPIAILAGSQLISLWAIPSMTLLPAILLGSPPVTLKMETSIRIMGMALVFPFLALLCAPLVALNAFLNPNANGAAYYHLLSTAAQQLWRTRTEQPLRLVVGDRRLADGIAFYAPGPVVVNPLDPASNSAASNLDIERVHHSGAIAVCRGTASECAWLAPLVSASPELVREIVLSRRFLGQSGRPATFSVIVVPPAS